MRKLDGAIIDLRLLMIVVIFYKLEYLVGWEERGKMRGQTKRTTYCSLYLNNEIGEDEGERIITYDDDRVDDGRRGIKAYPSLH